MSWFTNTQLDISADQNIIERINVSLCKDWVTVCVGLVVRM